LEIPFAVVLVLVAGMKSEYFQHNAIRKLSEIKLLGDFVMAALSFGSALWSGNQTNFPIVGGIQ